MTNCNLRSYASCIRIAWMNDGVIRNCAFSNLVMTDSNKGICLQLPDVGDISKAPDQGREPTRIENLTFHNIVMNEMYASPIFFYIDDSEAVMCDAIRNICFTSIRADGLLLPYIKGRSTSLVENISFSDCTFRGVTEDNPALYLRHGEAKWCRPEGGQIFRYVKNVIVNNTSFDLL